jgi:hypothetical protein
MKMRPGRRTLPEKQVQPLIRGDSLFTCCSVRSLEIDKGENENLVLLPRSSPREE